MISGWANAPGIAAATAPETYREAEPAEESVFHEVVAE
jgi:hypothetical protein